MNQFEKQVLHFIHEHRLLPRNHLLVACSGGVDSMALLHFLHKQKDSLHIKVSCVHVDHMLRGQQSYEDLLHVKAYCDERHIPFFSKSIPIPEILEANGGNVQAVCREQRYGFFKDVLQQISGQLLATAHHADDNVESILMSFVKNRSINGLKGIEPIRYVDQIQIIRPFLSVNKQEIREYLKSEGISWREDPSNEKSDYTRNRFRNEIIPKLTEENDQFIENVIAISSQIRDDDEYLMAQARLSYKNIVTKLTDNHYKLDVNALNREPLALQRRLLLILLNYVYGVYHTHSTSQITSQILTLCESTDGHREVHLPDGIIVQRNYDLLEIKHNIVNEDWSKKTLLFNQWTLFGRFHIYLGSVQAVAPDLNRKQNAYYFNSEEWSNDDFIVRPYEQGDRLLIAGMEQPKKIARILIDAKIPAKDRRSYPIIEANSTIIAVGVLRHHPTLSKSKRPTDDSVIIFQDDSL